jgi:hypothetical protein
LYQGRIPPGENVRGTKHYIARHLGLHSVSRSRVTSSAVTPGFYPEGKWIEVHSEVDSFYPQYYIIFSKIKAMKIPPPKFKDNIKA